MIRELSEEWLKMGQDCVVFALFRDVVCLLYRSAQSRYTFPFVMKKTLALLRGAVCLP